MRHQRGGLKCVEPGFCGDDDWSGVGSARRQRTIPTKTLGMTANAVRSGSEWKFDSAAAAGLLLRPNRKYANDYRREQVCQSPMRGSLKRGTRHGS